jgi:hypothetical protein
MKFKLLLSASMIWMVAILLIGYPNTILPGGGVWVSARISLLIAALLPTTGMFAWYIARRK